jgi:phenylalanine-4-hydroxylase
MRLPKAMGLTQASRRWNMQEERDRGFLLDSRRPNSELLWKTGGDRVEVEFIEQVFANYREQDHAVWKELYERRIGELTSQASEVYLEGLAALEIYSHQLPQLSDINRRLGPITGWESKAVSGFIPAAEFFTCLSRREFPTAITVRPADQLDYLPEPDIFHDVFGHIPMHAHKVFGAFLQKYGEIALQARDERQLTELQRLFWFTVEFGLIREEGKLKIYGSGLISSPGEGKHCLESDAVERLDFDLAKIIAQGFEIDHYQPILFVIDSFQQLYDSLDEYREGHMN